MEYNAQGKNVGGRRFSHLIFDYLPANYAYSTLRAEKELALDLKDQDIICVPSISLNSVELKKIVGVMHYEERSLFTMLFLRHPTTRLIYITSAPLDERIVQYYMSLMSDLSWSEVSRRLILLSTDDCTPKSLSSKILERPRLISRIKNIIRPGKSCMMCFATTPEEKELASQLGVSLIGCDPQYDYLGSKSGSRDIFEACHIPHPLGVPKKNSAGELAAAIFELLKAKPVSGMVVKLDQGFSGHGNALLDLSPLVGKDITPDDVLNQMTKMKFMSETENWEAFQHKVTVLGAIAEEYISGESDSPSVQGYITKQGEVELLSTHDQILRGQVYQGCIFPASQNYRVPMNEFGAKVGRVLAEKGARGYFGVDFLVAKDAPVDIYALEINLRQCGTTHPYFTMKLLTNGMYDKKAGLFYSNKGIVKFYRATDNLRKSQYCGLLPADLLDIATAHDLRYSPSSQSGVVFHLLGALSEHGKLGYTAIGDSLEEAARLYEKVEEVLDYETSEKISKVLSREQQTTPKIHSAHLSPQNNLLTFGNKDSNNVTKVFITVCVHGDEVCGLHAVNQLIDEGFFSNLPDTLQVNVMCANPLAVTKGVRFVDQNLNRAILPHLFEAGGYETFRARTIADYIFDADVYLDIHSTSSPSPTMCLPAANMASEELARRLPMDYVIEELAHAMEVRGTTIDWSYFHHKTAVSIECGQHQSSAAVQAAKNVLQSLLGIYSTTPDAAESLPTYAETAPKVMRCVGREKVSTGFKYIRKVTPFEHVKKGEALAEDENGPIICPFDLYKGGAIVTMPTSKPYKGEEAFFWVVPSETLEETSDE